MPDRSSALEAALVNRMAAEPSRADLRFVLAVGAVGFLSAVPADVPLHSQAARGSTPPFWIADADTPTDLGATLATA